MGHMGASEAVVDRPESITPQWLAEALAPSGITGPVRAVRAEPIGTGQIGASYRLHIDGDGVPATLVAKIAAGDEAARARVKEGYQKEVGFYTTFASRVRVRTPRCWHAAIAEDLCTFTLLLDDLAPAVPGVQADGCTVTQAADAVRNLAGLHAPVWNDPSLFDEGSWLRPMDAATSEFLGAVLVEATEQFVARYRDELGTGDADTLRASAAHTARWGAMASDVFSLVHGDYRLDNLMFPTGGAPGVSVVDWQTLTIGPPTRDLAYFLATSLQIEDRRRHERSLVDTYVQALQDRGVADYDVERCFTGYRLGVLQGPMITILGCLYATAERSERADGMFLAMATRSCAALRDLGSFDLVG
jgi:hypothetical protein